MKKMYHFLIFLMVLVLTSCQQTGKFSSSSSLDLNNCTSITEMLTQGEGNYRIQGRILKIQNSNDSTRIWLQNVNEHNQKEAILLTNCQFSDTLKKGDWVIAQGNYALMNHLPTMNAPVVTKVEEENEISLEPTICTSQFWQNLNLYDLNQYICLKNVNLMSVNEEENSLIVEWESLYIPIIIDCFQDMLTYDLISYLKENFHQNRQMNLNGMIDIEPNGVDYRLKIVEYTDTSIANTSNETKKIHLYGINDFHGAVLENGNEMGIVQLGSFLKTKKAQGNTLLINSGDFFQGSIESNYNYGALLTDCMNEIEFDCFTLGNHEFDWGVSMIQNNQKRKGDNGYQTPFLAANIYQYDIDSKEIGDYAQLGEKYTIKTLENGLKVGIIGVIGKDQITSISSQHVDDYIFLDPVPIIQDLSDELKTKKDVDVVIVDCHTDQDSITENASIFNPAKITSISPVSNQRYVDAVFCAHTHQNESQILNGVPFIQTSGYGRSISNIELEVDKNGNVSCTTYTNLYSLDIKYTDEDLHQIVEKYTTITDTIGQEVLTQTSATLDCYGTLIHVVTAAMADYAKNNDIEIDYAIANSGRADIDAGEMTYAELYRSLPFDNEIYIIETSGRTIKNQLNYSSNMMYRLDSEPLYDNETYTIAVLDYLALHRNTDREYNYFPDAKIIGKYTHDEYELFNYRDLTAEFLRNIEFLNVDLYSYEQPRHNKDLLNQLVEF